METLQKPKTGKVKVVPPSSEYDDSGLVKERNQRKRTGAGIVWTIRIVALAVVLFIWWLAVDQGWMDVTLLSTPIDVGTAFITQLGDSTFWVDVAATFSGAMVGLVTGAVAGIVAAVIFTRVDLLYQAASPFLTFLNSLPRPALAPIFILWFGLGFTPKALVAFSMVFFVLMANTMGGLQSIEDDISKLTKSLAMTKMQRFFKIEMPAALPSIISGLRLAAVYSILGAVVAEMVGSYTGLGQRLVVVTNNFQVADTFAILAAMGILSMIVNMSISALHKTVEKRTS